MNKIIEVIREKNKIEKAIRARQRSEMQNLKKSSEYRAKVHDEIQHIDILINDKDVDKIVITVPDRMMAQFSKLIYSEELAGYIITQVKEQPNRFYLERKVIAL